MIATLKSLDDLGALASELKLLLCDSAPFWSELTDARSVEAALAALAAEPERRGRLRTEKKDACDSCDVSVLREAADLPLYCLAADTVGGCWLGNCNGS